MPDELLDGTEIVDVAIRKPTPGSKAEAILTLASNTELSKTQIAEMVNTSLPNVCQTLSRYGIDLNNAEPYKKHRAEILAGLQDKILNEVKAEDIKSASLLQKVTTVGILYDKERLERNLSTDIHETRNITIDLSKAYEAMRASHSIEEEGITLNDQVTDIPVVPTMDK